MAHTDAVANDDNSLTLGIADLQAANIRFWTLSEQGDVLGCGALKSLTSNMVEVKSVHVIERARGQGIARVLMNFLIENARSDGYSEIVLETGSMAAYAPARALYERLGFTHCGPISGYCDDPNSVYMRLPLDPQDQ